MVLARFTTSDTHYPKRNLGERVSLVQATLASNEQDFTKSNDTHQCRAILADAERDSIGFATRERSTDQQLEAMTRETCSDVEIVHLSTGIEFLVRSTEVASPKLMKKKRMQMKKEM